MVFGGSAVDLEIATERGAPVDAGHRWLDVLQHVGFSSIRIRTARVGDRVSISSRGSAESPSFHVIGIVTRRNNLRLPGENFVLYDANRIKQWIKKLQVGGKDGLAAEPTAFGLTPEGLVRLHDELALPVGLMTKGRLSRDVVRAIARRVDVAWTMDQFARKRLESPYAVMDELQNVSCGTAMAATLRPLGLVLVPRKSAKKNPGRMVLAVIDVSRATESWPIGWPTDKKARQLAPQLFEFLDVDIQRQPLADVLEVLQPRIEIPMLLDHDGCARHRVDSARAIVSIPAGRSFYQRILSSILVQSMLTSEIRQDEIGNPFLWITPVKR